jgi:hypothetical protein
MNLVDYGSDSDDAESLPTPQSVTAPLTTGLRAHGKVSKDKLTRTKPNLLNVGALKVEEHSWKKSSENDSDPLERSKSIASLLPAPTDRLRKQRAERSAPSSKVLTENTVRKLGGGNKSSFDGEIAAPSGVSRDSAPPPLKRSKIIPAAIAARMAKSGKASNEALGEQIVEEVQPLELPDLFSFDTTKSDSTSSGSVSSSYKPVMVEKFVPEEANDAELVSVEPNEMPSQSSMAAINPVSQFESKRTRQKLGDKEIQVTEFNIDEFYRDNKRLLEAGALQNSSRPVYAIGSGRHQLTSLIASAQQNSEQLEARISEGKRNRLESGKKYGF